MEYGSQNRREVIEYHASSIIQANPDITVIWVDCLKLFDVGRIYN